MTRDDIIRMAREADIIDFRDADDDPHTAQMVEFLERFAYLVASAERNACAKIASNRYLDDEDPRLKAGYGLACRRIALDIQSR